MKHRILLPAFLLMGCASSSFAGTPESFANKENTVCLEVQDNRFGLRIYSAGGTHEVLGNGALREENGLLGMEYQDSFGNQVKGSFNPKSGILNLQDVKADLTSSAAAASYGHYKLKRANCTSNVLD